jgi:hypothetical protein
MKPKNENKVILKQWVYVFFLIAVLAILAFSIWAVVKSIAKNEGTKEELYTYNYNSSLDYKVYLKNNQFFTEKYIGMNKQYIASLVDHIDVTTKYSLQSSKELEYTYSYEMIATARGSYNENDSKSADVWSKAYTIAPTETKNGTGSMISIDRTVSIDYNQYNQIMTDFRNQFGLSVDASVDVALKVNISAGLPNEEKTLQESNSVTLKIPLLKPTFEIKPDYINGGHDTVYKTMDESDNTINIPLLIIGMIGIVISLFLLKKFIGKLLIATKKSEYVLTLNKILKEYADIIAEADNMPKLSDYDIVNIKDFTDLVDIEEELHSPIILTEVREDAESWFMIFHNKTAYKYILRDSDFEKIIRK